MIGVVTLQFEIAENDPGEDEAEGAEEFIHEDVDMQTINIASRL